MQAIGPVLIAAIAFVASHFVLSHPLRKPIVAATSEPIFLGLYSIIALGTFIWLIAAYRATPAGPLLWPVGDVMWAIITVVMLLASFLFMGSLIRNPALPSGGSPGALPKEARGVFAVTRHPMMWAFALWGLCHIAIFPTAANIVLAGSIMILALVGAALQDAKKAKLEPDRWPVWESKTSYWPLAAVFSGKAQIGGFGWHVWIGGIVVWLAATWAHPPVGMVAGIWRWLN